MDEGNPRRQVDRAAAFCGVTVAALGALGIAGWAFHVTILIRILPRYKAIAPLVALSLVLLGLILARYAGGRIGRTERWGAALVSSLISIFGLLEVLGLSFDLDLNYEDMLTERLAQWSSRPMESMSPVAGLLLFFVGAAIASALVGPVLGDRGRALQSAGGVLSLLSTALASVMCLGYVYGTPFLYGGPRLPIAATAASGLLLLSIGSLAVGDPGAWPRRAFSGDSAQARLLRAFVPLIVAVVIVASVGDDIEALRAHVNRALLGASLVVLFAALAALLAARVAGGIGEEIDRAHQDQQRAERARAELARHLSNEIAHRVKNNLAMVAGLLQMQLAEKAEDGQVDVDVLREAVGRIRAFSVLHERMYNAGAEVVELTDSVRRIAEVSREALGHESVRMMVEGEKMVYPTKAAANVCLMVNELITNGIKHGRPGPDGLVRIDVKLARVDGSLEITVWSSGNPVPPDFDVAAQRTMGMQVVTGIAMAQYRGSVSLVPHNGGTLATVVLNDRELHQDAYTTTT